MSASDPLRTLAWLLFRNYSVSSSLIRANKIGDVDASIRMLVSCEACPVLHQVPFTHV